MEVAIKHRAKFAMILEKAKPLFEAIPDSNPSPKVGVLRLYLTPKGTHIVGATDDGLMVI